MAFGGWLFVGLVWKLQRFTLQKESRIGGTDGSWLYCVHHGQAQGTYVPSELAMFMLLYR